VEPVAVIGALAVVITAGVVGFNELRFRRNMGAGYAAACVSVALLGLTALAYCFSLGFWTGVIISIALFALSQQNRIESLLVHGQHHPIEIENLDGQ
jgi:cobalamin biosynthesis protein CobD/CbiB